MNSKKVLLSEINRMRSIMGLRLISEQYDELSNIVLKTLVGASDDAIESLAKKVDVTSALKSTVESIVDDLSNKGIDVTRAADDAIKKAMKDNPVLKNKLAIEYNNLVKTRANDLFAELVKNPDVSGVSSLKTQLDKAIVSPTSSDTLLNASKEAYQKVSDLINKKIDDLEVSGKPVPSELEDLSEFVYRKMTEIDGFIDAKKIPVGSGGATSKTTSTNLEPNKPLNAQKDLVRADPNWKKLTTAQKDAIENYMDSEAGLKMPKEIKEAAVKQMEEYAQKNANDPTLMTRMQRLGKHLGANWYLYLGPSLLILWLIAPKSVVDWVWEQFEESGEGAKTKWNETEEEEQMKKAGVNDTEDGFKKFITEFDPEFRDYVDGTETYTKKGLDYIIRKDTEDGVMEWSFRWDGNKYTKQQ